MLRHLGYPAGNAGGDSVWVDLDTGIKAYETVDNIYDVMGEQGFAEEAEALTKTGDTGAIEDMMEQWEETLQSQDLSETYARKRIIKQEEVSYLPLSLQYTVEKESKTFAQVDNSEKDRVSFEVNGDVLAGFTASELQGKNILLSFQPASASDQAIYDSYGSIFDVPAYAVYMKPVLLVDNEVAAEGDSYLESTLGTKGSFTINLTSGGRNTSVTNDVTTGSMYAVTLDSQNITAEELQSVYDEAAALRDSVTEANVYSEEYLGKLLILAGKLYFARVDIADTLAADMYNVAVTRSLSEGITGYEVRTSSMYGRITSLSEGNLYIDIDTDSHGVVSLNGEEDAVKEYMSSTGMASSLYESAVWEELTGYKSVSTISVLAKAQEENIDILLISSINLDTEIEKLNTDEATKQSVINAVNSGMVVTIPAEDITMGEWTGTGYIVTNPATGAGEYIISGGLNGGALAVIVTIAVLCACFASVTATAMLVWAAVQFFALIMTPFILIVVPTILVILMVAIIEWNRQMWLDYMDYIFTGDLDSAESAAELAKRLGEISLAEVQLASLLNAYAQTPPSSTPKRNLIDDMDEIADDIIEINRKYSDGYELNNSIKNILNSASYYDDPYEQIAAIIRSITDHAFVNGNKRTAFDTLNMLLDDFGLNSILTDTQKWNLISDIAEGRITDVAEIARIICGK